MTQRSPCYSAVSASLRTLYQIILIICHFATPTTSFRINTSLVSWIRPITKPFRWRLILLLRRFTAKSSWELMSLEEYCSALGKLNNKHRQVVMFLFLMFKQSSQLPFVSLSLFTISILFLLPYSILYLLPFLISTSLSIIFSFSYRFSVLLR